MAKFRITRPVMYDNGITDVTFEVDEDTGQFVVDKASECHLAAIAAGKAIDLLGFDYVHSN